MEGYFFTTSEVISLSLHDELPCFKSNAVVNNDKRFPSVNFPVIAKVCGVS